VVTLVAVEYGQTLLVTRSAMLDEMGSDYLTTARAKGLRDDLVRRRHAVPNALLPTVTLIFVNLGRTVAGVILVETVFSWPGLGGQFYQALSVPDLPLERLVSEQDLGLIMISHNLAVLADTCDRLAVMYAGRVVEEGPARQVYEDARHPYGRALSEAFPRIGDPASRFAPRGLPGDPPDPAAVPSGCAFHPRCPVALDVCATQDQVLTEAGAERRAACVHVTSGTGTGATTAETEARSGHP
jgi:oligopeptide/dipeptide ABC transporter ATP-binding protein